MTHCVSCRWDGLSMLRLLPLGIALCCTAACSQRESPELEWARAALQRNPDIEIVATDAQAGVFTLRDKHDATISTVSLKDLVAVPTSQLAHMTRAAPATAATPPAPVAEPVAPSSRQLARELPTTPEPPQAAEPAASPVQARNYTIERTGGQLKVSGPGVSIVSAKSTGTADTQAGQAQPSAGPIICEGHRMLHLDSRDIHVDGDAIIARGGCDLYVTNSRVVASGTGIVVQDAIVHIANSRIEGGSASFDAGSGAQLFVRGSTLQGLSRRDEHSSILDQGGNQWR